MRVASSTGASPKSASVSAQDSTAWCPSPPVTAGRKRERSLRRRTSKAGPASATTSRGNGPSNVWCRGPSFAQSNLPPAPHRVHHLARVGCVHAAQDADLAGARGHGRPEPRGVERHRARPARPVDHPVPRPVPLHGELPPAAGLRTDAEQLCGPADAVGGHGGTPGPFVHIWSGAVAASRCGDPARRAGSWTGPGAPGKLACPRTEPTSGRRGRVTTYDDGTRP